MRACHLGGLLPTRVDFERREFVRDRAELASTSRARRRIYEIAFALGFASEAHFSRAFKRAFGLTPKDVPQGTEREIMPGDRDSATSGGSGYGRWVRQLSLKSV